MRQQFLSSLLIAMAIAGYSTPSEAVPCPNTANIYKGPAFFADQKMDSLTIAGPGDLQSSTITGKTVVIGPFKGEDCTFHDMDITGPLTLVGSSFTQANVRGPVKFSKVKAKGRLQVLGPLEARNADLQDVVIQTQTLSLSDSKVRSLIVKANRTDSAPQRLHLQGNTTVDQITFERGDEVVVISGDAVRAENITGAKVERS